MNSAIIKIRYIQLVREFRKLGYFYTAIILLAVLVGIAALAQGLQHKEYAPWIVGGFVMIVFNIHYVRSDHQFLKLLIPKPYAIYSSEYLIVILPVLVLLLTNSYWLYAGLLMAASLSIPFIQIKPKKRKPIQLIVKWIPAICFEWVGGVRKTFWLFLALYALGVGFAPFRFATLIVLWVLMNLVFSFYRDCESVRILAAQELPPRAFLGWKIKLHLKVFAVFMIPLAGLYLIFHSMHWWIVLSIVLLLSINLLFSIVSKYANFEPNETMAVNDLANSLALMSILIPFLLPIPIVMGIRNYRKAIVQLNEYLDAYH